MIYGASETADRLQPAHIFEKPKPQNARRQSVNLALEFLPYFYGPVA